MTVWVLIVVFTFNGYVSGGAPVVIDNIQTAQSCEQLARVFRGQEINGRPVIATCAPVRKVKGDTQ